MNETERMKELVKKLNEAAKAYYRAILRYLGADETTENQSEP